MCENQTGACVLPTDCSLLILGTGEREGKVKSGYRPHAQLTLALSPRPGWCWCCWLMGPGGAPCSLLFLSPRRKQEQVGSKLHTLTQVLEWFWFYNAIDVKDLFCWKLFLKIFWQSNLDPLNVIDKMNRLRLSPISESLNIWWYVWCSTYLLTCIIKCQHLNIDINIWYPLLITVHQIS